MYYDKIDFPVLAIQEDNHGINQVNKFNSAEEGSNNEKQNAENSNTQMVLSGDHDLS